MRLDGQQKMIALLFGLVVILMLSGMIFVSSRPETRTGKQIAGDAVPVISTPSAIQRIATSTKAIDLSPNGWWDALPTAKPLPTMPGNAIPTVSQAITSISSPPGTLFP